MHVFGETGTGKECVARALHAASPRGRAPFVALNASSLSDELFEAEMFGHARGAFTGAVSAREGQVAAAEGGTLFLDEVADLTPRSQARLLRFLQEREYRRVGETAVRRANLRVLTAANVRLERARGPGLVPRGPALPAQRRHPGPAALARARGGRPAPRPALPAPGRGALGPARARADRASCATPSSACSWPGNVRQLQNEMERLLALSAGEPLRVERLSPEVRQAPAANALPAAPGAARSSTAGTCRRRSCATRETGPGRRRRWDCRGRAGPAAGPTPSPGGRAQPAEGLNR